MPISKPLLFLRDDVQQHRALVVLGEFERLDQRVGRSWPSIGP